MVWSKLWVYNDDGSMICRCIIGYECKLGGRKQWCYAAVNSDSNHMLHTNIKCKILQIMQAMWMQCKKQQKVLTVWTYQETFHRNLPKY